MRPEVVVATGAALLIGALAGVEWWAEHQWPADAVVRPADLADPGLPTWAEVEDTDVSASPHLTR